MKLIGYQQEVARTVTEIDIEAITRMAGDVRKIMGTVYTVGNGGSAANASHCALHLNDVGVHAVCLTDNAPLLTARSNDTGYISALRMALPGHRLQPPDAVIAFSCSGGSGNIWHLLEAAKANMVPIFTIFGCGQDATISVDSQDYGVIEDVHSSVLHMLKKALE